ncbi:hypothetical protein BF524_22860 [Escherichia coli]|nr:hypothetical protein [Escherichia coli]EGO9596646.1 hypothetical protein [Escherichia coli]
MKTPGLQRPFRSRRLCRAVTCAPGIPAKGRRDVRGNAVSRRDLRSWHPGKRPPGCEGQRRFAHALFVVAAGPCPLLCPVPYTRLSPCRRGQRQPQPSPPVQG